MTAEEIQREVIRSLKTYESRAELSCNVFFLSNKKGFRVDVTVKYRGEERKLKVVIDDSLLKTLPER
jgi:hypothetical protein